jgi:2-methylaconitate cis-trans-isomerase PrpF
MYAIRTATCGNMLSAVAVSSIESILPKSLLHSRSASLPKTPNQPLLFPVTILSASNGMIMRARVPIDPTTFEIWDNKEDLIQIAGVPGEAAGIELEMPLVADDGGLVTGNVKDIIKMNDLEVNNYS